MNGGENHNMKGRFLARALSSVLAVAGVLLSMQATATDIEPPAAKLVDKFGVNMANGQVTHSLSTVSIGGAMGLSHSVSVIANEFNFTGYRGFQDKFYARARNVRLCIQPGSCNPLNVMRVHDFSDTVSFAYHVNGVLAQSGDATSGYTYVATDDERHTLEGIGNELVWTKPDGTVVRFDRGTNPVKPATAGGLIKSVEYPNGFTIWVNAAGASVNTNTGFQIKHFFEPDNRPMGKTDNPNINAPAISSSWQLINPKYVRGINAAVEHCAWTSANCTLQLPERWPKATFEWPAGMPRTMYIGDSIAKVIDAAGLTTQYKFRAYDLAYGENGIVVQPYTPGTEFSPRLIEITPPGATAAKVTYDFKNLFAGAGDPEGFGGWWQVRLQSAGIVKQATRLNLDADYDLFLSYQYGDTQNMVFGPNGISLVHLQNYFGNPSATYYVDTLDGRVWFEETGRNFPRQFNKSAAPVENYYYATRSNLTRVTYNGGAPTGYEIQAEYPATCTPATRKICNQATRMRDANGNWTDYTYHAESGQVASITQPPNKRGVRPKTTFTYLKFGASFYGSNGSWIDGAMPESPANPENKHIWLKTEERSCIGSRTPGVCEDGEVVTTYEYDHHNRLLTGVKVTTPSGVRRTCYRYDIYGNQIGVTTPTPNANLAKCPGVTP
jgi:hypothetical protein